MKKTVVITLIFSCVTAVFGQTGPGYQNYLFGMSVAEVKAVRNDLINVHESEVLEWFAYHTILYYLYRNELPTEVPNPLQFIDNDKAALATDSGSFKCVFVKNKLISVTTEFISPSPLPELINRYGNGFITYLFCNRADNEEARVWTNNGRVIYWWRTKNGNQFMERVVYVDEVWIKEVSRITMENYKLQLNRIENEMRSRID